MKKILLFAFVALLSTTMSAQLITSTTVAKTHNKVGGMFIEAGLGTLGGDYEKDGMSIEVDLGYRRIYSEYVGWDIIKLKGVAELANFSETLTPKLISALRFSTPAIYKDMTAFASFGAGYGYGLDLEAGGLVYEIQAGVNFTERLYAAFVYENQNYDGEDDFYDYDRDIRFTGIKVGIRF